MMWGGEMVFRQAIPTWNLSGRGFDSLHLHQALGGNLISTDTVTHWDAAAYAMNRGTANLEFQRKLKFSPFYP